MVPDFVRGWCHTPIIDTSRRGVCKQCQIRDGLRFALYGVNSFAAAKSVKRSASTSARVGRGGGGGGEGG